MATKKSSLLLIGNAGSIHIYNYVKNVISPLHWEVTILSTAPESEINKDYKLYFISLGIKLEYLQKLNGNHLSYVFCALNTLSSLGCFDYLHVHYVSYLLTPAIAFNKNKYGSIILSFWGSDFYRDTNSRLKKVFVSRLVRIANKMSFITEEMYADFKNKYSIKKGTSSIVMDFGNLFFDDIKKRKEEINHNNYEAYSLVGLDPTKPVVTIGYSGRKEMQQYETICAILKSDLNLDCFQIAVPAYGISDDNKKRITLLLESHNCKYRLYDFFMDIKQTSSLRAVTNIFIHTQTTDALSSAMSENFFSGSVVINGGWLNYVTLDKAGVFYLKANSFEDIPTTLKDVLDHLFEYQQQANSNVEIIKVMCSWDYLRDKWLELYN